MGFSFSTLLTTTVFCNIIIINLILFTRKKIILENYLATCIILCMVITMARMFFPLEFKTAKALPIKRVLPDIVKFVHSPLTMIGKKEIYIYHSLHFIWIVGAAVYSMVFINKYVCLRRIVQRFPDYNDERINRILRKAILRRRKHVNFRVLKAPNGVTPFIIGYKNPIIVMPDADLSDNDLLYVLNHEITHYYKGDIWLKTLLEVLCVLYWWNPVVFVLKRKAVKILEVHTDLSVVKYLNKIECIQYLESIINIAKMRESAYAQSLELSFNSYEPSDFKQRVRAVMDYNGNRKLSLEKIKGNLSVVIITAVFIICSVLYTVEPYFSVPYSEGDLAGIKADVTNLVKNPNGRYDLYYDDKYLSTISEIDEVFSKVNVFKNLEEVQE